MAYLMRFSCSAGCTNYFVYVVLCCCPFDLLLVPNLSHFILCVLMIVWCVLFYLIVFTLSHDFRMCLIVCLFLGFLMCLILSGSLSSVALFVVCVIVYSMLCICFLICLCGVSCVVFWISLRLWFRFIFYDVFNIVSHGCQKFLSLRCVLHLFLWLSDGSYVFVIFFVHDLLTFRIVCDWLQ